MPEVKNAGCHMAPHRANHMHRQPAGIEFALFLP